MQCPKCAYARRPSDTHVHAGICPSCGIAYRKWRPAALASRPRAAGEEVREPFLERLVALLAELPENIDATAVWARVVALCALAAWTVWFASNGISWEAIGGSFLHNVNLPFHEFGHVFFMPFGEFLMILGGSLFQLLLPLVLMGVFVIRQGDNFAGAAMLWWHGQNYVDLSPYIIDAEYRVLPLVGGRGEESHDWGNLLTMLDAVDSCYALARASYVLGLAIMLLGLGWGALQLRLQFRALNG